MVMEAYDKQGRPTLFLPASCLPEAVDARMFVPHRKVESSSGGGSSSEAATDPSATGQITARLGRSGSPSPGAASSKGVPAASIEADGAGAVAPGGPWPQHAIAYVDALYQAEAVVAAKLSQMLAAAHELEAEGLHIYKYATTCEHEQAEKSRTGSPQGSRGSGAADSERRASHAAASTSTGSSSSSTGATPRASRKKAGGSSAVAASTTPVTSREATEQAWANEQLPPHTPNVYTILSGFENTSTQFTLNQVRESFGLVRPRQCSILGCMLSA